MSASFLFLTFSRTLCRGVVITETNRLTALAETNEAEREDVDAFLYQDEYFLSLTKVPTGTVEILISNVEVASDRESSRTPDYRNFDKRAQVYMNGTESTTVVFDSTNWTDVVKILVTAIGELGHDHGNVLTTSILSEVIFHRCHFER